MEKNCCKMTEQETMNDLLSAQKYLTGTYNAFCNEAATPELRHCLCTILSEEHTIGQQVFEEMSARGYYPTEKAEDTKLNAAKQKFAKYATV